jgi:hypothetical protein
MNLTLHNKAWWDIIDDREWWEKTLGTEDLEEFDEAVNRTWVKDGNGTDRWRYNTVGVENDYKRAKSE